MPGIDEAYWIKIDEDYWIRQKAVEEDGALQGCTPFSPSSKNVVFDQEHCTVDTEVKEIERHEGTRPPLTAFEQDLRFLINKRCMENDSNTPDRILAEYLSASLQAFNVATRQRERWYGRKVF